MHLPNSALWGQGSLGTGVSAPAPFFPARADDAIFNPVVLLMVLFCSGVQTRGREEDRRKEGAGGRRTGQNSEGLETKETR